MRLFVLLSLLTACCASAIAQPTTQNLQPAQDAMQKLSFMVGTWEGEGWMMLGPGNRQTSHVTETAELKLEGTLLVLEGLGKSQDSEEERIVHHALGIISYDAATERYLMRAYRAGGQFIDADLTVGDQSLIWGFTDPKAGEIRYTFSLTESGQWHEVGEISRDGENWFQFFEMTLDRQE